jgi:hypothetical protein
MISSKLEVWQIAENRLIEKLPDGSTAVFDTLTKTVHSINKTAAAAFEACRERQTVPQLATAMGEILNAPVTEEMALAAILELERAGLVACSGLLSAEPAQASRRSVLKAVGTVAATAAPLVLSLSMAEQSVYAQGAGSGTTTTTTTTTTAAPAASISNIAPDVYNGCASTAAGFVITGVNTHFSGASVVTFSLTSLTASNVVVNSLTSLTLTINNSNQAAIPSSVTVTVTTGSEVAVGNNLLQYEGCT